MLSGVSFLVRETNDRQFLVIFTYHKFYHLLCIFLGGAS